MPDYYTYGAAPGDEDNTYGPLEASAGPGLAGDDGRATRSPGPTSVADFLATSTNPGLAGDDGRETTMPTGEDVLLPKEEYVPGVSAPSGTPSLDRILDYKPPVDPKTMAAFSLLDLSGLQSLLGTSFADPNIAATAQYIQDTRPGWGSGGSWYETGVLEGLKNAAQNIATQGLWSQGYQQLLAEDPELYGPQIEAMKNRELAKIADFEKDYAVMKPLSDLLKANKFQEAFAYAEQNGLTKKLMDTRELQNLRPAFTQQEMRDFFAAVPPGWAGGKYNFKPDVGVYESLDPFKSGIMMETGYPDPTRAFKLKDDKTVENLTKVAVAAMLTAGLAPIFSGTTAAGTTAAGTAGTTGALSTFAPGAAAAQMAATGSFGSGLAGAGALGTGAALGAAGGTSAAALPTYTVTAGGSGLGAGALGAGALGAGTLAAMAPTNAQIAAQLEAAGYQPTQVTTTPTTPVEPLDEVVVSASKAAKGLGLSDIVAPLTAAQILSQAAPNLTQGYQPTEIAPDGTQVTPQEPLEEVVIQSTRPPLSPLTAAQILSQTVPDMMKDYQPTQVEESPLDKFKNLADKVGGVEKLLKALGALGAGAGARRTTPTTGVGAGGMGGALPKYELQRTQLQPAIDYYRYGLGPEAKFFEDKMAPVVAQPETTEGPPAGRVNPEEEPVFAKGGLAKGGRYMEGPGSGREDKIPALLSDGEYVMDAETLALLGDGSTKEGAKRMDKFRANIRKHKGRALSRGRISPNAKSPSKYVGGGLT